MFRSARRTAMVATTIAMFAGCLAASSTAHAAKAQLTVKPISTKIVAAGSKATVKPIYTARKGVRVRSAKVTVRKASTWVARGANSVKLAPGTYRVTTRVAYGMRGSKRANQVASRTQTLRVLEATSPSAPAIASPPATSLSATGAPCDASTLRKPDGQPWTCSFVDEFSGSTLDTSKWMPQQTATSGYGAGGECFLDRPENVSVGDGVLALTVRKEAEPFTCASPAGAYSSQHSSGMVSTAASFAQAFGRFEIRASFPKTDQPGLQSALWLWPTTHTYGSWPHSGEIDIAEMYSTWPDRVIPFLHYASQPGDLSVTNNFCMIEDVSDFHTYTLEWTASTLSIAYDGQTCLSHRIDPQAPLAAPAPFDRPFMIALTQALGVGDNAVTSRTPERATTQIDYVRVWQ